MWSFIQKLFKRGSGKSENTGNGTEKQSDNSDLQDGSSFTNLKVIQLQQKSRKLVKISDNFKLKLDWESIRSSQKDLLNFFLTDK